MPTHIDRGRQNDRTPRRSLKMDATRGDSVFKVTTPATPAEETSAVWEVIERRKREKAELEEALSRKEAVAYREREEVTNKPRHACVGDIAIKL